MKLAVNRCFGGFSLSPEGEREYLKRKGKTAFFYRITKFKHDGGVQEYERVDNPENTLFQHCVTRDLGKTISDFPKEDGLWFSCREIPRDDLDLIAVCEELGEKADGQCAQIEIVEVPDGIEWEIDEYDGSESVDEKHRSW